MFLQLMAITLHILAEIVSSLFTGRGDPSELCRWTSWPWFDLTETLLKSHISFGDRIISLDRPAFEQTVPVIN